MRIEYLERRLRGDRLRERLWLRFSSRGLLDMIITLRIHYYFTGYNNINLINGELVIIAKEMATKESKENQTKLLQSLAGSIENTMENLWNSMLVLDEFQTGKQEQFHEHMYENLD